MNEQSVSVDGLVILEFDALLMKLQIHFVISLHLFYFIHLISNHNKNHLKAIYIG